jgi:hypothetical protein
VFWVIPAYLNIKNTLPKADTFLLGHPVYIHNYSYGTILENYSKAEDCHENCLKIIQLERNTWRIQNDMVCSLELRCVDGHNTLAPAFTSLHFTSPHLTSLHLTSFNFVSPHFTLSHLTSPYLTSLQVI